MLGNTVAIRARAILARISSQSHERIGLSHEADVVSSIRGVDVQEEIADLRLASQQTAILSPRSNSLAALHTIEGRLAGEQEIEHEPHELDAPRVAGRPATPVLDRFDAKAAVLADGLSLAYEEKEACDEEEPIACAHFVPFSAFSSSLSRCLIR